MADIKRKSLMQIVTFCVCVCVPVCACLFVCAGTRESHACICVLCQRYRSFGHKYSFLLQSLFVGFCRRCEPIVNTVN